MVIMDMAGPGWTQKFGTSGSFTLASGRQIHRAASAAFLGMLAVLNCQWNSLGWNQHSYGMLASWAVTQYVFLHEILMHIVD